jgi:hypothetical protein
MYYPGRSAEAVAVRLHVHVVEFPGAHPGYTGQPDAFAASVRTALAQLSSLAR